MATNVSERTWNFTEVQCSDWLQLQTTVRCRPLIHTLIISFFFSIKETWSYVSFSLSDEKKYRHGTFFSRIYIFWNNFFLFKLIFLAHYEANGPCDVLLSLCVGHRPLAFLTLRSVSHKSLVKLGPNWREMVLGGPTYFIWFSFHLEIKHGCFDRLFYLIVLKID
jgi:hypothetical protein